MVLFLIDSITRPGTTSVVVAHEEFITQRLLAKARFFESLIPKEIKPTLHHSSSYELSWPDINSVFYIGSARSYIFGRGERIDNFLASEIAFWPSPEKIMIPALQSTPPNARVVLESTPFGEGTYFHEQVKLAEEQKSVFKLHFFPWWLNADYQLDEDSTEALPKDRCSPLKDIKPDEQVLIDTHNLTENQLRWRRMKLAEIGADFYQEYPEDTETCFISGGNLVFNKDILDSLAHQCYKAHEHFENTKVWYPPQPGGWYIVGVDPTVGITDKA
jgi:hypothetical protein